MVLDGEQVSEWWLCRVVQGFGVNEDVFEGSVDVDADFILRSSVVQQAVVARLASVERVVQRTVRGDWWGNQARVQHCPPATLIPTRLLQIEVRSILLASVG